MNKELIKYTLTSPKRLIVYYATILQVKWKNGIIHSVKGKTYLNRQKDYPDNYEFIYPKIPTEIIEFIVRNKATFLETEQTNNF